MSALPCWGDLPVILILSVTVDGDDADSRAWRIGDDYWLRLVPAESRVVNHSGSRLDRRDWPGYSKIQVHAIRFYDVSWY